MAVNNRFNLVLLIIGIMLIITSIITLKNPVAIFMTLAIMLGIVAIVSGTMLVVIYYRVKGQTSFKLKMFLVFGILLVIIGLVFLFSPSFLAYIIAYIIAILFIVHASNNLINAGLLKTAGKGLYGLSIILSILLLISGIILLFNPMIAGVSISLIIGLSLLFAGIECIIFACFKTPRRG